MFTENSLAKMKDCHQKGYLQNIDVRLAFLKALYKNILHFQVEIQTALYEDLGKSFQESYMCEIFPVLEEIKFYFKNLAKLSKSKIVAGDISSFPSFGKITPAPYGCVLIISPWNYPVNLTLSPLVHAIAAGNCAVVKPSELSQNCSNVLKVLLHKTFPTDICTAVLGDAACAQALLDMSFDYIFYTGSPRVGKKVMASAAKNLTPLTLELGGKSPCIIHDTLDMHKTAKRICWGKLLNSGQTCVAPDYVLIKENLINDFITEYKQCCKEFFGEHPLENDSYPKIINANHFRRICEIIADANTSLGGEHCRNTQKIAPTLLVSPSLDSKAMTEEIFGPVLPVIPYSSLGEAVAIIRSRPTPLALYIFSHQKELVHTLTTTLEFGGCCINDTIAQTVNIHLPFGGKGESGFGATNGKFGFQTFTRSKSILYKKTGFDNPLKFPPYGKIKQRTIEVFTK